MHQDGDRGQKNVLRYRNHLRHVGSDEQSDQQQGDSPDQASGYNHAEQFRLCLDEHRSRLQPVHIEDAEDDRRYGVSRDSKGQHGNQGSSDTGVVACFRCDDSLISPFPEGDLRVLHDTLRFRVGEERGNRSARTGKCSDQCPDRAVIQ